jgi:peptidoglycan/LPS O-acetylase OafA/YrhL
MAWKQEWLFEGYNHFWSLAIEEHFYLVWPLIMWKCNQWQAERACLACIGIAVIVRLALVVGGWNSPTIELFTLSRIDGLAAGAWLALLLRRQDPIRWNSASSIACIGVGGLFTILGLTARKWLGPGLAAEMVVSTVYTWLAVGSLGLVLSALFASRPESKVNPWNSRWLAIAGKYSYGWYVFQGMIAHDLLALGIVAGIAGLCGSSLAGRFVQIMVGGGISLAMAVLSWHLFESRILSWKDRLAPRD